MAAEYTVGSAALYKLLLHSLKYPAFAINGVFLGTHDEQDGGSVHLDDAIPMFHSHITLAMPLEAALAQVAAYAEARGQRVVGYYQASERLDDCQLGAGKAVSDTVRRNFPRACALVLNSAALQSTVQGKSSNFLELHLHDVAKGWTRAGSGGGGGASGNSGAGGGSNRLRVHVPALVDRLRELAKQGQQRRLADFEDHLDDISKDWANEGVVG